jgi:hypothetical protein
MASVFLLSVYLSLTINKVSEHMLFNEVIEKMNLFTISAVRTSDRKMMSWNNEEWATHP